MNRLLLAPALALGLFSFQEVKPGGAAVAAKPPAGAAVYTGKSVNGNLQEALADALQKAQAAATKTVADAQFDWQLDRIYGKRGGITGSQEVSVDLHIVR